VGFLVVRSGVRDGIPLYDGSVEVGAPKKTALTRKQIEACREIATHTLEVDTLVASWNAELKETPLADISFTSITPPLKNLNMESLSPGNSKRRDLVTVFADISGFTDYIRGMSDAGNTAEAIQALHVIRKELRDVLKDFSGRKIRYIGDAIHGVVCEGTAAETDSEATVSTSLLCCAAMRDAFQIVQEQLPSTASLGLSIGFDLGPVSITRLGVRGSLSRCGVGRTVLNAERVQSKCSGSETAIGVSARLASSDAVKGLLKAEIPTVGITYNRTAAALDAGRDTTAMALTANLNPGVTRPRAYGY